MEPFLIKNFLAEWTATNGFVICYIEFNLDVSIFHYND